MIAPTINPVRLPLVNGLRNGLRAFYRNSGTDTSGNGKDLAAVGSPTTTTGLGGAADAALSNPDGSGYYQSAAGQPLITFPPFTFSCFGVLSTATSPVFMNQFASPSTRQSIRQISTDTVRFSTHVSASQNVDYTFAADDAFHHMVGTYDGVTATLWFDGANVASGTKTFALFNNVRFQLAFNAACTMQFAGVWDRVLTEDEITQLYNSGNGLDPTA